jgi:hypothetical protein
MATLEMGRRPLEDEDVPDLCMQCGAPAEVHREKTFSWYPPWVFVLLLAGLLPFIIVALVLTKKKRVPVPLCRAHRNHWAWRNAVILLSFLGLVGLVIGVSVLLNVAAGPNGFDQYGGLVCAGSVVGLVVWLVVVAVLQQTAIRPTEITDSSITLTGVSKEFVRAYEENRGASGRDWDDERWEGGRRGRARPADERVRPEEDEPRRPPDAFQEG